LAAGGSGWQLAEWITEGEPGIDMMDVDPRRFGAYATKPYTKIKNEECYEHVFVIHYPDEERGAGRPLKMSPCHDRMAARGAEVVVADINQDMLDVGIERAMERGITSLSWSCQNAEKLSYPSGIFDAYTIAFGIRNVTDIPAALKEAHRVLKLGGRFFCLEFSTTEWPGFKEAYDLYSHRLVPKIGKAVANDEESYRYLIESIRRFPKMPEFEAMIRDAGFVNTRVEPIMGGLVAIHSGWKV